jgi:hypothetical protein
MDDENVARPVDWNALVTMPCNSTGKPAGLSRIGQHAATSTKKTTKTPGRSFECLRRKLNTLELTETHHHEAFPFRTVQFRSIWIEIVDNDRRLDAVSLFLRTSQYTGAIRHPIESRIMKSLVLLENTSTCAKSMPIAKSAPKIFFIATVHR